MTRWWRFKTSSKYPDSTYQPNANYWLGQLNYNKGEKDDAAFYFASVVKNYPKSPKAPDAMFKVGVIMQDKGDTAKAKAVYQQVINKFPAPTVRNKRKNDLMLLVDYGMTRNRVISGLVA